MGGICGGSRCHLPADHAPAVRALPPGVGKSSVATQLALSISAQGKRVGLLDADLTGPSQVRMCGLEGAQILQSSQGWLPAYVDKDQRLAVMSVAMLLKSKNDSVVWRGPKKNAMIKQFLGDVRWDELDYLIIDTPPGESFAIT